MNAKQTSIEYLKGVGPERARLLKEEVKIKTVDDLLHFFPNRYIDRSQFYNINELPQNNSEVQIKGKITEIEILTQKRGKRMVAHFEDKSGKMELIWFRGYKWIRENLKLNQSYIIFGRINWFKGFPSMPHPEMELEVHFKKSIKASFYPVYPSTEKLIRSGISQRVIQKLVLNLIEMGGNIFSETLPKYILDYYRLLKKSDALKEIHFPTSQKKLSQAQMRLKFEELTYIQLQLILKNLERKRKIKGFLFSEIGSLLNNFYNHELPYQLTSAQKRVIREIREDMGSGRQMNRLLQGDVGSGKTIVALFAILIAIENNYQTCFVAPTEILAQQHFASLQELLSNNSVNLKILTGSTKVKDRKIINQELENGKLSILIGTHAVFEENVIFKNLGLAIIDEQHRFGVAQRAKLWSKNSIPPHILVMTATPIPRTLAMSLYGDLDISLIDEMPPGRKSVKTMHRYDNNRLKVFQFIKERIEEGEQIYVVYPLIEESEKLDFKDLMDGYESLSRSFPIPKYQISILHGKMKAHDKAYEMKRFADGKTQIMVATTVIEVGVNIPNASVMIIESAERFGLSQLHQLRGRVGRGNKQSFCILMSGSKMSDDSKIRIQTMVKTNNGFEIAEADLKLRGPGNILGTQQSGILRLKIADIVKDNKLLKIARMLAIQILKKDPKLEKSENQIIKRNLSNLEFESNIWNLIS
tara:strand:+ start:16755 stop:18854 length:2100 start_codon:yes stop_codon:yes gene_type:complete